jgi:peptidoglycan DL-endopeptidase CwlO
VPHGRKRLSSALIGLSTIAVIGFIPTSPAVADPEIDDVEAKVDRLYHEAEVAQERYNDAKLELTDLRKDLRALRADQKRQDDQLASVREQVTDSVLRQYQGESVSAAGQVLVSDDPSAFLGQLSTMSAFNDMQAGLFERYGTEIDALELREDATAERAAEIQKVTDRLAAEKKTVEGNLAEAQDLLDELEAEEREQLTSRSQPRTAPTPEPEEQAPAASGGAAAAVQYALAQVGDAYVYGATGDSAFDCSGLTMRAWGAAGVSLPHSSSAQMGSGQSVSPSALQPGDLVFYYSPVSHVGIYIGNGQLVHAANPSTGVQVTGVNTMPISGAVRPG